MCIILIIRKHHREPVPKGKILPGKVKPLAALVGPDRANARPDCLTGFILARGPAVVEDIRWCVWHGNTVSATTSSVGDWQSVSTRSRDGSVWLYRARKRSNGLKRNALIADLTQHF